MAKGVNGPNGGIPARKRYKEERRWNKNKIRRLNKEVNKLEKKGIKNKHKEYMIDRINTLKQF